MVDGGPTSAHTCPWGHPVEGVGRLLGPLAASVVVASALRVGATVAEVEEDEPLRRHRFPWTLVIGCGLIAGGCGAPPALGVRSDLAQMAATLPHSVRHRHGERPFVGARCSTVRRVRPRDRRVVPTGDDRSYFEQPYVFELPADRTYWFAAGVHTLGTDEFSQIVPSTGDSFIGAAGAVLDGQDLNRSAFDGEASSVTIKYLAIEHLIHPTVKGW